MFGESSLQSPGRKCNRMGTHRTATWSRGRVAREGLPEEVAFLGSLESRFMDRNPLRINDSLVRTSSHPLVFEVGRAFLYLSPLTGCQVIDIDLKIGIFKSDSFITGPVGWVFWMKTRHPCFKTHMVSKHF